MLVAEALAAQLKPGMRALDVGSGTGYLTVAMALMVGTAGKAVGVEHGNTHRAAMKYTLDVCSDMYRILAMS